MRVLPCELDGRVGGAERVAGGLVRLVRALQQLVLAVGPGHEERRLGEGLEVRTGE